MHFRTLLFVEVPETKQDPEWEKQVLDQMEEYKTKYPGKIIENAMISMQLGKLTSVQTTFGLALNKVIMDAMERFYCATEDPRFLVFDDRTDEYLESFNEEILCVLLPDGGIVEANDYAFQRHYVIQGTKVYQKIGGKYMRTRLARQTKLLPNYPRSKLYKSFDEYVEEEMGGCRNGETGRYGEWFNPDGIYDWYSVGGRWPERFLVKMDCTEYSYGERASMKDSKYPAPEGYRWVACARKKDIQWDAMRAWRNQQATERFHKLEEIFKTGNTGGEDLFITPKGINHWGELIYQKNMTLEQYLSKYGIPAFWKYPISVCGIFTNDTYLSDHDALFDKETKKWMELAWRAVLEEHIDKADDDTVLVGIDYHM